MPATLLPAPPDTDDDATGTTAAAGAAPEIPGMPAPTLPMKDVFGEDYPAQTDPDGVKMAYVDARRAETETDQLGHYRQSTQNMLYANGRQRLAWNKRRREWDDLPTGEGEIHATYNLIRPILRARAQRLLSPKVTFTAIPGSNDFEARDRAAVATRLLQARWTGSGMDDVLTEALDLVFSCGVAALKGFWNPDLGPLTSATMMMPRPMIDPATGQPVLGPDGQPQMTGEFDEVFVDADGNPVQDEDDAYRYRPGDTDTALRTIFHIRLNPEARGFTPSAGLRWLLDEEMVPMTVLRARYPAFAKKMKPAGAGSTGLTYERMAAASVIQGGPASRPNPSNGSTSVGVTSPSGSASASLQRGLLREFWQLPDRDYFPHGRLLVIAADCVVYDGDFPQAVFPYVGIYDEPASLTWRGRASVNDMISPQTILNRELTAIVREMDMTGAGQFMAWDVPGVPTQITAEHGAVIKIPMRTQLAGKSINEVIRRMDPASVPPDRQKLIELATQSLYAVGAFHEVSRGQVPPGVDSGVAVKALLEQEAGQLLRSVRALRSTILAWGRVQLGLARWGYGPDETRWIPVKRPDLGFMVEGLTGSELPDPDTLELDLESFRPTSEADYRGEVKEAMQNRWIDPGRGMELLDLGQGLNPLFLSQTRHYARARRENLALERGLYQEEPTPGPLDAMGHPAIGPDGAPIAGPPMLANPDGTPWLLPEDDDPQIHMLVLDELILDDTKPPQVRAAARAHKAEHRAAAPRYVPALAPPVAPQGQAGAGAEAGLAGPALPPPPPPRVPQPRHVVPGQQIPSAGPSGPGGQ